MSNTSTEKRYLDKQGLIYFARVLSNYPDNAILSAVIDAISIAITDSSDSDKKYIDSKIDDLSPRLLGTMEEEVIVNPEFSSIKEIEKLNTIINELNDQMTDLTPRLIGTINEEEIINPEFDAITEIQKINTAIDGLKTQIADLTARLNNITNQ